MLASVVVAMAAAPAMSAPASPPALLSPAVLSATSAPVQGIGAEEIEAISADPSTPRSMRSSAASAFLAASAIPGIEGDGSVSPPDAQAAVGAGFVLEVVGGVVRVSTTDGSILTERPGLEWWRVFDPTLSAVVDPAVGWEPVGERFVMAASVERGVPEAGVVLAVSRTSDPTGAWWMIRVDADQGGDHDVGSTRLGHARGWITVAVDRTTIDGGEAAGSLVLGFDRGDAEDDDAAMAFARIVDPVRTGIVPVATTDLFVTPQLLVSDDGSGTTLTIGRLGGTVGSPSYKGLVATVSGRAWSTTPVDAPQAGSSTPLDTGDTRLQTCSLRNGSVWCAHTVFLPAASPTRAAVQWWQFLPEGAVLQQGRIGTADVSAANPSMAVNEAGDVLLGYSRFSADTYVSGAYRFRTVADPVGSLGGEVVFAPGEAPYVDLDVDGRNRWGDTSATVVGPDGELWTLQPSAAVPGTGGARWRTTWAQVGPSGSTAADVAVAIVGAPARVLRGRIAELDLVGVANGATGPANVTLSLTTPDGAKVVSAPALCDPSARRIDCPIGSLDRGETARLAVRVKVQEAGPVTLRASVSSMADPNPSNDVTVTKIEGLDSTTCTHRGTSGNDQLFGTPATDVLCAEGGDDVVYPSGGEDLIVGGRGYDYVAYLDVSTRVEVDLGARRAVVAGDRTRLRGIEGAFGGPRNDALVGDGGDNVLTGLGGDDRIDGEGGADTVSYLACVGDPCTKDRVVVSLSDGIGRGATVGTDVLRRIEHVYGSPLGDDRLTGDEGANFLYGFGGRDELFGLVGNDYLSGGDGDDRLEGGRGDDYLSGGAGSDRCVGGQGPTTTDTCP